MTVAGAVEPMDADAFLALGEAASGNARRELLDGRVVTMTAEQAGHARVKNAVLRAFEREIAHKACPARRFRTAWRCASMRATYSSPMRRSDVAPRCRGMRS